jgi:hypothetical protein
VTISTAGSLVLSSFPKGFNVQVFSEKLLCFGVPASHLLLLPIGQRNPPAPHRETRSGRTSRPHTPENAVAVASCGHLQVVTAGFSLVLHGPEFANYEQGLQVWVRPAARGLAKSSPTQGLFGTTAVVVTFKLHDFISRLGARLCSPEIQ